MPKLHFYIFGCEISLTSKKITLQRDIILALSYSEASALANFLWNLLKSIRK